MLAVGTVFWPETAHPISAGHLLRFQRPELMNDLQSSVCIPQALDTCFNCDYGYTETVLLERISDALLGKEFTGEGCTCRTLLALQTSCAVNLSTPLTTRFATAINPSASSTNKAPATL